MAKILYAAGTYTHIKCFHLDYIKALKDEGHEVLTMASGEGADFNIAFQKKMFSFKNLKCISTIKKILKREGFDAIILNTTLAAFNIRMALPRKKRPTVLNIVHGYMFSTEPSGLKEKIFLLAEKLLRKKTDSVIVMNEEDLISAKKYSLCRGECRKIEGMGAKVHEQVESVEAIRARLGYEGKYIITFVGELSYMKNQNMLISLLPRIKESIKDAVLCFPGVGEDKSAFIELADSLSVSDSVVFPGYVSNPCDYVRASDLYVSPSRKEGLPFNVIEALGVGKTVIATDIRGHRDLIESGKNGILFNKDSEEELLEKILAVHSGKILLDKQDILDSYKKYSKDEVLDKTLAAIKESAKITK